MTSRLTCINGPADLKKLGPQELEQLAADIRQELVATVTNNGGHLASNLGVVELTIALHNAFDSPQDKIVWDVGHQSYVHKLLTGRRKQFATIRQHGGLSGFPDPDESPHDAFGTGHASTSISAALGMAAARDLAGDSYHVIAVIGDGALGGGMALEAVNHAGHLGTRLIVVLNDNGMSISPSVGAISRSLSRLRLSRRYQRTKRDADLVISKLPGGRQIWQAARRVKEGIKRLLLPTMIWEELGFTYVGPVDGHSLAELKSAFERAKAYTDGPIFIHVVTRKGMGFSPAETDAVAFHGVSPNGVRRPAAPSYSKVFGETVLRIAKEDPRVVAITAAMPEGTGLNLMARELPERVYDVGICEQHAVTFAAGLAKQGFIPVVAIYSTFLQRALDQVIQDVCLQNLPVVFALDRSGVVGDDGKTHQGAFDLSYLGFIPNMVVVAPRDENELQHMVCTAVRAGRPMAIRYPRGQGWGVALDKELKRLPVGKGTVLHDGGSNPDIAIVALGSTVVPALEAANSLSRVGIRCLVADARFARPLDSALILEAAGLAGRVVTVEENALCGGFGSAVLGLIADAGVQARVERLGLPDEFIAHGTQELLRAQCDIDATGIARRVLAAFPELATKGEYSASRP